MWRVKKRKFLRNKRGQIIGRPGDTFAADNVDALACPSAVEMVAEPAPPVLEVEIVEDDDELEEYEDDEE